MWVNHSLIWKLYGTKAVYCMLSPSKVLYSLDYFTIFVLVSQKQARDTYYPSIFVTVYFKLIVFFGVFGNNEGLLLALHP